MDLKTFAKRVQRRFTNTVILCQTADPKPLDACLLQLFLQSGSSKCRVVVLVGIVAFTQDFDIRWQLKSRMERRSRRALDAMRGPRTAALFEADVMWRMPVTRYINWNVVTLRFFNPAIEDGHHLMPAGYS